MAADPNKPKRRSVKELRAIDMTLKMLGAPPPTIDDIAAIRALARGHASPIQQQRAVLYLMGGLCNIGTVTFTGEQSHSAAFRTGAQAVGIAFAQIGDAVLMRFPQDGEKTDEEVPSV